VAHKAKNVTNKDISKLRKMNAMTLLKYTEDKQPPQSQALTCMFCFAALALGDFSNKKIKKFRYQAPRNGGYLECRKCVDKRDVD